ncbi:MAG: hypothetical protein E6R06_23720 [Mycobacterium sp.]|nr:MAG: hypothetical protein E6R06_23720 [Mycobacterium sp.]
MQIPMPASLGPASWRVTPHVSSAQEAPVHSLGAATWRVKPTTASVVTAPKSTGDPSWRPNRAD